MASRWSIVAALVAGCAPVAVAGPGPERIPSLEAALRTDPASTATRVQLGAAYEKNGDAAKAVATLEPALDVEPDNAPAALVLGLAYEDLGRLSDARALYARFLANSGGRLRSQVEDRLERVRRAELEAGVRTAIAEERTLAATPPEPLTAGVFPFLVEATDTSLRPLGRAMAELLSTDLGATDRLRVVERSRIQYLLDEIELARSGYVQPATAARAGHIIGAANIVQGRLEGTQAELALQAAVVPVDAPERSTTTTPSRETGPLDRVLDMEKSIALDVYGRLGIQLTTAERERVEQRPTRSVQALLAFGFGLEAEDGGRYVLAVDAFTRALSLDPGFELARQHRDAVARLVGAANQSPGALVDDLAIEFRLDASPLERLEARLLGIEALIPDPQVRDASAEALGRESLVPATVIRIIIRRPGGLD
ncbi:MAG: tetratricopeptide repeat protein [Gemmatimonadota bacterium]|jgi:tetratricopeptide (TPR) repeat protein